MRRRLIYLFTVAVLLLVLNVQSQTPVNIKQVGDVSVTTGVLPVSIGGTNTPFPVKIDQTTPGTTNAIAVGQIGATTVLTGGVNGSLGIGGLAATGVAVAGNPIRIAGKDGSSVTQDLSTIPNSSEGSNGQTLLNAASVLYVYDNANSAPIRIQNGKSVGNAGDGSRALATDDYGQYTTPQANSTAPLAAQTTGQYSNLQTDSNGRLITTPGVTQMAWQTAQVSGVTATTTTRNTFTGLGQFNNCYVLLRTTTTGTATGTLQIYIEDSTDGGTTWDDLISSLTIAFGAAVTTQRFTLSGNAVGATITTAASTNITQGSVTTNETLAAGSARQGPWGDQIRIREKVSGPSGSPVGVTYKIDAVCKN